MRNIKILKFLLLCSVFYVNSNLQAGLLDWIRARRGKVAEKRATREAIKAERLGRKAAMTIDETKREKRFQKTQKAYVKQKKYQDKAIKLGKEFTSDEKLEKIPTQEEIQGRYEKTSIASVKQPKEPKKPKSFGQKIADWLHKKKEIKKETKKRIKERPEAIEKEKKVIKQKIETIQKIAQNIHGKDILQQVNRELLQKQIYESRKAMIDAAKTNDPEKFKSAQKKYLEDFGKSRKIAIQDRVKDTMEAIKKGATKEAIPVSDLETGFKQDISYTQGKIEEEKKATQKLFEKFRKKQPEKIGEPQEVLKKEATKIPKTKTTPAAAPRETVPAA
ncbi:hypothetical protein K9M16_02980 [Candidatus Babeliales bacterium]|nr:hypothetical protein [Candidatus Babeliales bacterium]